MSNSAITQQVQGLATPTSPGLVGTGAQTFGGVKTFNGGLVFAASSLSDAQATILGLKQYLHGTTYNGGIAPTVTCGQAGFAVGRAVFVPYQMQDGSWRLKFNITSNFTSATITSVTVSIAGISFKTGTIQSVSSLFLSNVNPSRSYANPTTGDVLVSITVSSTAAGVNISGDVELDSKPTWAY